MHKNMNMNGQLYSHIQMWNVAAIVINMYSKHEFKSHVTLIELLKIALQEQKPAKSVDDDNAVLAFARMRPAVLNTRSMATDDTGMHSTCQTSYTYCVEFRKHRSE